MAYCPGDCLFSVLFYFSYSFIEAGMDDFLAKPVEIKVLKEMLGKYMRKDLG